MVKLCCGNTTKNSILWILWWRPVTGAKCIVTLHVIVKFVSHTHSRNKNKERVSLSGFRLATYIELCQLTKQALFSQACPVFSPPCHCILRFSKRERERSQARPRWRSRCPLTQTKIGWQTNFHMKQHIYFISECSFRWEQITPSSVKWQFALSLYTETLSKILSACLSCSISCLSEATFSGVKGGGHIADLSVNPESEFPCNHFSKTHPNSFDKKNSQQPSPICSTVTLSEK